MFWDHRRGAGSDTAAEKVLRVLVLRKDAADQGGSAEQNPLGLQRHRKQRFLAGTG